MRHTLLSLLSFPILLLLLAAPAFAQATFDVHEPVSSIDITTDGKKLAIAGRTIGIVYDIESKMIERVFDQFGDRNHILRALMFSKVFGNIFLCLDVLPWRGGNAEYRNYVTGMVLIQGPNEYAWPQAFSKITDRMVSIGRGKLAILQSFPPFNLYNVFSHPTLIDPICADISPNGNRVVAGYLSSQILVWDYNPHMQTVTIPTMTMTFHKNSIYSVQFNPINENQFLSASWDGTARLWDITNGKNIIRVFNTRSGGLRGAAFSPDGRLVATGGADRKARLWLTASGALLREFTGHTDLVTAVMFTPDGRQLVTASFDGTVRFWPI